ncbi:MAG: hypothetical protein LQ337_007008 [Flavoplaca oasis]|nr:MAG: hypothetical protein LQ337_007008 [Flavoplaca oasis]
MLLRGLNPAAMVSSYAREQAPGIQYKVPSTQRGGDPEPTRESLVSDKATGDGNRGESRPADPSMSTNSTRDAESMNQVQDQDQSTTVQTTTWVIASKASQKNVKKRAWTEESEIDDAGSHTSETKTQDEAPKRRIKRFRPIPGRQTEGPSTRTRAAAKKSTAKNVDSPRRSPEASRMMDGKFDKRPPAAVAGPAKIQPLGPTLALAQSPSQASRSGSLKRGRVHQESEREEDEEK